MNSTLLKKLGLSGNALKIIALITMTLDHVGLELFDNALILRIIGRIAFPIFAYMIAEGCEHTRNRKRYFLTVAILAAICQIVYFVAMGSLYQCILVTFSLSILTVYAIDNALKSRKLSSVLVAVIVLLAVIVASVILPEVLYYTDYGIDYGLFGILLPVFVYFAKGRTYKLAAFSAGLVLVCLSSGYIQWYSLLTIPLIAMYNGTRGRIKLKNLFYVYYPVHLVIIYLIGLIFKL